MKTVSLQPIGVDVDLKTESNLLQALLAERLNVLMACGGKGLCATCHVHVEAGGENLTPITKREQRTLGFVSRCDASSRLACQARVLGEGVVVRVPEGMYIERSQDLVAWIGKRAKDDMLHPITGAVLVPKGKVITRSRVEELQSIDEEMKALGDREDAD